MTKQKDLKRIVRSRMAKTGESYTAARRNVLEKKSESFTMPDAYVSLAGMSDGAVRAKTGRTWPEWTRFLDGIGAAGMAHRDIAAHLNEKEGLPGWWAQTVTVGYERIRGLRAIGQRRSGTWEANKSRTYPVPIARLFRAFSDGRARSRWLPERVKVRKATDGKSVRMDWSDGSLVVAYFVDKGEKSAVQIQHQKLASKAEADEMKVLWGERLGALGGILH